MKSALTHSLFTRRALSLALLLSAVCFTALLFSPASSSEATAQRVGGATDVASLDTEALGLAAFKESVGGSVTPFVVELKGETGVSRKLAAEQQGQPVSVQDLGAHAQTLVTEQEAFLSSLPSRGVRALVRETNAMQIDGSVRRVRYEFTYLLNGFVAYVADADVERLRAMPEVASVSVAESPTYFLDKAIDYSLGTQQNPAERRTAVYGATKEFRPIDTGANPETPRPKIDGFEGQNMRIAVIDSGTDWRHPMFGGTGLLTPLPRVSGQPASPSDNKKIIYYFALSSPGDPTDDFGHGTLVASCAAGYSVNGDTPPRAGYGTGRDGTGVGPTLNGAELIGTAPQAQIMAYKVCGPAPQCPGDIPLSIEDAASPFTLVRSGSAGPTPVAKPIADVINLSLGDTSGDPAAPSARAANNAALAGTIVVASAGNSGPGAGTIGSPSAATLAISVAASLDPGSVAGSDVLAAGEIPFETRAPAAPGPSPEMGASSNQNAQAQGERQGIRIFPIAGGGSLPNERTPGDPALNTGSVSAHYVFVDRRNPATPIPSSVTNRIAVVKGTGAFAAVVNPVAAFNPAAIILVNSTESATAVAVVGGIPAFTMGPADGDYLLDLLDTGDDDSKDPTPGVVSRLPLRLAETIALPAFEGTMAGFSSRGPNDHANARFRTVKPDVSGPGVGVAGAATVEGLPDETVGLASTTGYTQANGTSFSGPITAGAMALVRQYVRETLGLDLTDSTENRARADFGAKRFDTVTVARALLMNSATNLRNGFGTPQGEGAASVASVNDMGAGHINVAGALQGKAVMVAPTPLLTTPAEFSQPSPSPTPRTVLIPSVSYGPVPVVGVNAVVERRREVIIRDVGNGAGAGTYNLSVQNNRLANSPGFNISFTDAAGAPLTSVAVAANGQTSFFVRVLADGNQILGDPTEFQWYVTAASATQTLRMPFYYRAVRAEVPNITAPNQLAPLGTEQPSAATCPGDTNGSYTVSFEYQKPADGPNPVGFRVQEATRSDSKFFDNADEPLAGGANSKWTGSAQWNSQVNPETGSLAYFVPNAANQAESLTMVGSVVLPPGGATLSFDTFQSTEEGFDFTNVDVSSDGVNFNTIASFSGLFSGTRFLDLTAYAGQTIKVRFRMTSDLAVPDVGWYVENIRVSSDDFRAIANLPAGSTSLNISGRFNGTYFYRVAAIFNNPAPTEPGTTVTGPYSNVRCVTVTGNPPPAPMPGELRFSAPTYAVGENGGSIVVTVARENGSAGTVSVDYATSNGTATAGTDYTAGQGTLTFEPGQVQKEFTIAVLDDTADEDDETVTLTLTNPTNGAILGVPSVAALTIIDNETPAAEPGTLRFSSASYSVAEDAGTASITVTRSGGSAGAVSVSYTTADGSASSNSDYTPVSGMVTFAEGELTRTFTVPIIDDSSVETDETVLLTISNPTGGATLGTPSSATLTILDTDRAGPAAQLLNISTRLRVQGGERVGIGGFIITGAGDKRILVRGIGPSLTADGQPVAGRLQDPVIELYDGNGQLITSNDNWKDSPERADIENSGLAPTDDAEAAIARTLPPGSYTAIVFGKDQSEGIAIVEGYDRDRGGSSEMANISTRGVVGTDNDVLIGGFIAGARSGATNVIVRAIGPSLTGQGVSGALQDPVVTLFDRNGEVVDSSDDWRLSGDQGEVTGRGLAPQDDRESAAFATVAPGDYTVIVSGKANTTGVGLVEIYNVQ